MKKNELSNITFTDAKKLAFQVSRLRHGTTYEALAEELGIPFSTVHKFMNLPDYHPSMPTLPRLCRALGNQILVQWLMAQMENDSPPAPAKSAGLAYGMATLAREASEDMASWCSALEDGDVSVEDLEAIQKELKETAAALHSVLGDVRELIKRKREAD